MSESTKHMELVNALIAHVRCHFDDAENFSTLHDLPGPIRCDKPPKIGSYRPDVYATDAPTTKVVIGEAKTADDLETSHTIRQLLSFLQFLRLYPGSSLILAVPWSTRIRAMNMLEAAAKQVQAPGVELIVIDDTSEVQ